jgi:acetyl-CoA synthetase
MSHTMSDIDVLLQEHRKFEPDPAFRARANIASPDVYAKASADVEKYWAEQAAKLEWSEPWSKVLDWKPPHAQWFLGGKLNASVNCVDRHIRSGRRNKAALIFEGEPGDRRTLTYWDLYVAVNQFASVLKSLGVEKGDRVAIYLPLIPEAAISMLACARIGAIHSVIFGGFSPESVRDRINDSQCKVLITADGGYRRGAIVPLKRNADKALEDTPSIQHVVVVQRRAGAVSGEAGAEMTEGRDKWWHRLMRNAPMWCEPEPMDAEDPLHLGYHGQAEGHRPHHRWLHGRRHVLHRDGL